MKICFYNYFHNGDLLATKEYVREFIQNIEAEYYYAHNKHPKNLIDLELNQIRVPQGLPHNIKFAASEDVLFINTWVGAYSKSHCSNEVPYGIEFDHIDLGEEGICWKSYHKQFEYILSVVKRIIGKSYSLMSDAENYAHSIDYSKLDLSSIEHFFNIVDASKTVLVSNGLVESSQALINNDMSDWINYFAKQFPETSFVCTKKFYSDSTNIFFTDDVIKDGSGHDMNEIAYLSSKVNKIIGRNSGPFLFTNTKENLSDENKKFLAIGDYYSQCFPAFLKFNCDFKFVRDESESIVLDSIRNIIDA